MSFAVIPFILLGISVLLYISLVVSLLVSLLVVTIGVILFMFYKQYNHQKLSKKEISFIVITIASPVFVTLFFFLSMVTIHSFNLNWSDAVQSGITFSIATLLTFIIEKLLFDALMKNKRASFFG
ncbi:MAG: hypothetical protein J4473_05635 [Candidatus Aenigmarchaeota archaeon]|nr:hypothetical protein [Candidatus Aenigmarchaeota archaeon]